VYGLLTRLLVFVLLIWLARSVLGGLFRIFSHAAAPPREQVFRGQDPSARRPQSGGAQGGPQDSKLKIPPEDVIDVPFTDVDPPK